MENENNEQVVEETKFMSEGDDSVIKVDLNKPLTENEKPEETKETPASKTDDSGVAGGNESAPTAEKQEEVQPEAEAQESPVLEEITDEEVEEQVEELEEEVEEAVAKAEKTGEPLPENIQKLVDFMNETGGDINDYVKLNQDYSKLDNLTLLREYYKQTKPHLTSEEVDFMMEDQFSYDEEVDEDRDIKRKKLALKEQVASARQHLDGAKS